MLRTTALIILSFLTWQAAAGNFDFLPAQSGAEKEFRAMMESGDFKHAALAWGNSFGSTAFGQSQDGTAVWAYLLYQNGLPYTGLQTLIQFTQPKQLNPSLVKLWTIELKNSPLIQKSYVITTGGWKSIVFNDSFTIKIRSKVDVARQFAYAQKIAADNPNQRTRVLWQIANQAPQFNDVDSALKALKLIKESGQTLIGSDLVTMTQARVLYQKGELDAALNTYQQIPKSSDLWLDAVEERAWTHLRKEDYDKALGVTTTALTPVFASLATPETFFLSNLMSLRTCDYKRLFETSEVFKTRQRQRLQDMQELASKGSNRLTGTLLARFEKNGVSVASAGPDVGALPHGIFRDQQFVHAIETRRILLSEITAAGTLFEDAKVLGGNREFDAILSQNKIKAERLKQLATQRASKMAQTDLKEYRVILNKMHILEAEVIERLHLDDNLKGERSKLSKNEPTNSDTLVFPYTTAEVWMDELDNYEARVKDCPTLKGASL